MKRKKACDINKYPCDLVTEIKRREQLRKKLNIGKGIFQKHCTDFGKKIKTKTLSKKFIEFVIDSEVPSKTTTFTCSQCGKRRKVFVGNESSTCDDLNLTTCDTQETDNVLSNSLTKKLRSMSINENYCSSSSSKKYTSKSPDKNGRYTIEKILSSRFVRVKKKDIKQYKVLWSGWSEPTWEPAKRITMDVPGTVMDFEF